MKILKRNYTHRNLIIFLILSLVYLQAIAALSSGQTIFSPQEFSSFIKNNYFILISTSVAFYTVVKIKKYSDWALVFCLSLIVGKNFILLSDSFNKLTLVLNFIYLVFAFYFYVTWEIELGLACFNPKFTSNDLEKESRFKIEALVNDSDKNEKTNKSYRVYITNIDEESCFIYLKDIPDFKLGSRKWLYLDAHYEGVHFHQRARVVSLYDQGVGLVFDKPSEGRASWSKLYKVCLQRGYVA